MDEKISNLESNLSTVGEGIAKAFGSTMWKIYGIMTALSWRIPL